MNINTARFTNFVSQQIIITNKVAYYSKLQAVRDNNALENWILYILKGVEKTALDTIGKTSIIKALFLKQKHHIRNNYKFYSQDLINNLFKHPYTNIEFIQNDMGVLRITAANYLNLLAKDGLLSKNKLVVTNYYINAKLFDILTQ